MLAKKIKVIALHTFEDLQEKVIRKKGDEFEVSKSRLSEINKKSNELFRKNYVKEVN